MDNETAIDLLEAIVKNNVSEMRSAYRKLCRFREDFKKHPYDPNYKKDYLEAIAEYIKAERFLKDSPNTLAKARQQIHYVLDALDEQMIKEAQDAAEH